MPSIRTVLLTLAMCLVIGIAALLRRAFVEPRQLSKDTIKASIKLSSFCGPLGLQDAWSSPVRCGENVETEQACSILQINGDQYCAWSQQGSCTSPLANSLGKCQRISTKKECMTTVYNIDQLPCKWYKVGEGDVSLGSPLPSPASNTVAPAVVVVVEGPGFVRSPTDNGSNFKVAPPPNTSSNTFAPAVVVVEGPGFVQSPTDTRPNSGVSSYIATQPTTTTLPPSYLDPPALVHFVEPTLDPTHLEGFRGESSISSGLFSSPISSPISVANVPGGQEEPTVTLFESPTLMVHEEKEHTTMLEPAISPTSLEAFPSSIDLSLTDVAPSSLDVMYVPSDQEGSSLMSVVQPTNGPTTQEEVPVSYPPVSDTSFDASSRRKAKIADLYRSGPTYMPLYILDPTMPPMQRPLEPPLGYPAVEQFPTSQPSDFHLSLSSKPGEPLPSQAFDRSGHWRESNVYIFVASGLWGILVLLLLGTAYFTYTKKARISRGASHEANAGILDIPEGGED